MSQMINYEDDEDDDEDKELKKLEKEKEKLEELLKKTKDAIHERKKMKMNDNPYLTKQENEYFKNINNEIKRFVFICGGIGNDDKYLTTSFIYDNKNYNIMDGPKMSERSEHVCVTLSDGSIFICGGRNSRGGGLKECEIIKILSGGGNKIEKVGMNIERCHLAAVLLLDGRVFICGGGNYQKDGNLFISTNTCEIYDPKTNIFTPCASMIYKRHGHTASLLPNGKVYICGGIDFDVDDDDKHCNLCELYDPNNNTFRAEITHMKKPRRFHTATTLLNGDIFICGGGVNKKIIDEDRKIVKRFEIDTSTEIYDSNSDRFDFGPDFPIREIEQGDFMIKVGGPRYKHFSSILNDGKVLIGGGIDKNNIEDTKMEIFDPKSKTFEEIFEISTRINGSSSSFY